MTQRERLANFRNFAQIEGAPAHIVEALAVDDDVADENVLDYADNHFEFLIDEIRDWQCTLGLERKTEL